MKLFGTILPAIFFKKKYYQAHEVPEVLVGRFEEAILEADVVKEQVAVVMVESLHLGWFGLAVSVITDWDVVIS